MIYRMPATKHSSFPLPKPELRLTEVKLYSLFRKVNKTWIRISTMSYPEKTAYIVFAQSMAMSAELQIREIEIECNQAR